MRPTFVLIAAASCSWTACDDAGRPRPGATTDAACESPALPAPEAGTCRFARMPIDYAGRTELLNAPSERLSAPPGGLWWLATRTTDSTVTATDPAGAGLELEVVDDPNVIEADMTALRVPPELSVGERLRVGCSELTVAPPLPAFDLDGVVLEHALRPELGGRGFLVRLPPDARSRVFVIEAWVHHPGANVATGILVLEHLLLADAPTLCSSSVDDDAGALFVPAHVDTNPGNDIGIGISLRDADVIERTRFNRVCGEAHASSACYPSTRDVPL